MLDYCQTAASVVQRQAEVLIGDGRKAVPGRKNKIYDILATIYCLLPYRGQIGPKETPRLAVGTHPHLTATMVTCKTGLAIGQGPHLAGTR